jgi:hypothetical protein
MRYRPSQPLGQTRAETESILHNGSVPTEGGSLRRFVCIGYLYHNPHGTMKRVVVTSEGVDPGR